MLPYSILVVDDNKDAADAMSKLLRAAGFNTFVAYSGQEALKLARARKPKFILLDIRMPEMDGYEVARKMRADQKLVDSVLIALTGFGQEEDKRRAEEAGFSHHLIKPATLHDLRNILAIYTL